MFILYGIPASIIPTTENQVAEINAIIITITVHRTVIFALRCPVA